MYIPREIFESMPRSGLIDVIQSYQLLALAMLFLCVGFPVSLAAGTYGWMLVVACGGAATFFTCGAMYYLVAALRTRGTYKETPQP